MPAENDKRRGRLDDECRSLCRYLLRQEPTDYVLEKYGAGSTRLGLDSPCGRFDALLLAMATSHPLLARASDAYARFFAPHGHLRKKMVLLLAIAEVSPPFCRALDASDSGGRAMFFARVIGRGTATVLSLLLALPLLLPLQLILGTGRGGKRDGGSHG